MKRYRLFILTAISITIFSCIIMELQAQTGYTYTPWRETDVQANGQPQPLDFMTLGDQNHKYVRCRYGNNGRDWNTHNGTTGTGLYASHIILTTPGQDPCRCYQSGSQYIHEDFLPPSWDGVPGHTQDRVIRIGCYQHSGACMHSQEIEYWFYPPKDSSTLLVYFSFAQENVSSHTLDWNPKFYIEMLDGTNSTSQTLIPSDYYRRCNSATQSATGTVNTAWPYSRFLASPAGTSESQNSVCGPDEYGITHYYWATSNSTPTTPTTFDYRECPVAQTSGNAAYPVTWFEYKPLAFDLSSYANQNKAVRFRVRAAACEGVAHWAYGMFAAKLIPGYITVDACGDDAINLSVPWGFSENSYEWHYGRDAANSSNILEPGTSAGVAGTVYNITLDPTQTRIYPYYRCVMQSYSGVPFTYEAYIKKYDIAPSFEYEQVVDPNYPCSHIIHLHNTGTVSELIPKDNGIGYDTTLQMPIKLIDWYYKNSAGVYQRIPGSAGDTNVVFNVSNTADINLTNFNYGEGGDSIMIKVVLQDSLQKCIDSIEMNIGLDSSFVQIGKSDTTVFACNDQLPYFYNREKYGEAYRWDAPGTKECHVGADFVDLSWNGCDSVVTVKLEVMSPKIEIEDLGDYCDTFKTTLTVVPMPGQPFSQDDIHVRSWNGDSTSTGINYRAEQAGIYTVIAGVGDAGCLATASYKIAACMPFVNLPNTITPSNHDGINDCFEIPQKSLVKSLEFTVYNRNGAVVYHTTDVNFKWRGARFSDDYPEAELSNQTYVYTLKLVDYNGKPYPVIKGMILVL